MKEKDELHNLLNASGYLLQLAVEKVIRESKISNSIREIHREHPWKNSTTQNDGFIDLVVETGFARLVIECKRPKGGIWLFLVQNDREINRGRWRWISYEKNKPDLTGFHDFSINPISLESDICIIRGKGENDKPLLERLTGHLLEATDCLAS